MANKQYAYINPEMLKWAREETPLELNAICTRLKDITEDEIIKWESGEEFPSITNAKKLANLYDIPFAALYLTEVPPSGKIEYVDRRTLSTSHLEGISYELWKEIRYFKSCRESMLSMIGNEYDITSIPMFDKNDNLEKMIEKIREYFEIETPLKNKTAFGNNVFSYFRRKIERKGILVFQISGMEVSQIRGISLNYEVFPIIAVNKKIHNSPHITANNKVDIEIASFIQWSTSDFAIVFAISSNECSFNEKDSGLYVKAFPFHSFTRNNLYNFFSNFLS